MARGGGGGGGGNYSREAINQGNTVYVPSLVPSLPLGKQKQINFYFLLLKKKRLKPEKIDRKVHYKHTKNTLKIVIE